MVAQEKQRDEDLADGPKIYVVCLASYNAGKLHGCWIDALLEVDEIYARISRLLNTAPVLHSEEFGIFDHEGFEGIDISEHTNIERISELAQFVEEHGSLGAKVFNYCGEDLAEAITTLERYVGIYISLADFAEELTDETEIPENIRPYIDYESMGRDIDLNGDIITIETGFEEIHIFWAN